MSVIDYVIGDDDTREEIKMVEIGDNTESDHHPIIVTFKGEEERKEIERRKKERKRGNWSEEGAKRFREKMKGIKVGE